MTASSAPRILLDEAHARFIQQDGISVNVASRTAGNAPRIARGLGCRVSADRARVTFFIAARQYAPLVEAVAACSAVAVVFSQPGTHRTIQLKGEDAAVERLAPGDLERLERYAEAFAAALAALGYREEMVRAFLWADPSELRAVSFTPSAAFEQTPGPSAGTPLRR